MPGTPRIITYDGYDHVDYLNDTWRDRVLFRVSGGMLGRHYRAEVRRGATRLHDGEGWMVYDPATGTAAEANFRLLGFVADGGR